MNDLDDAHGALFNHPRRPTRTGLGRLPGDIVIERENFTFYFPLAICLVIGLLGSLVSKPLDLRSGRSWADRKILSAAQKLSAIWTAEAACYGAPPLRKSRQFRLVITYNMMACTRMGTGSWGNSPNSKGDTTHYLERPRARADARYHRGAASVH